MRIIGPVLGFLAFTACATAAVENAGHVQVRFEDFIQLRPGVTSSQELKGRFGEPSRIIPIKGQGELWSFSRTLNGEDYQRLNLVIDPASGVLSSATWIPDGIESLTKKSEVLKRFPDARFVEKDVGIIAGHEYSDDAEMRDDERGLSFYFNKSRSEVFAISLGQRLAHNTLTRSP